MILKDINISSPIEGKIAWAEECQLQLRERLLENKTINGLLKNLRKAIHASHIEMNEAGIVDLCKECEEDEGGSCCGTGMEDKYDGQLLLINLLLGVELPKIRNEPQDCYFLRKTGCLLMARHVICINYLCKKITERIEPQKIMTMREKEGEEINFVFLLHEQINRELRMQGIKRGSTTEKDPPQDSTIL